MKNEPLTITVKQSDIEHYIAYELNEKHEDYAKFVRGIKEFFEWVKKP